MMNNYYNRVLVTEQNRNDLDTKKGGGEGLKNTSAYLALARGLVQSLQVVGHRLGKVTHGAVAPTGGTVVEMNAESAWTPAAPRPLHAAGHGRTTTRLLRGKGQEVLISAT